MAKKQPTDALLKELREFGLTYPGAHTKSPWPGHLDLAVNDKTFAYLSVEGDPFSISCKLPGSGAVALLMPFTKPTAYGLGKSGWVSAEFEPGQVPDLAMLKAWVDESYRSQAPKKLVKELDALGISPSSSRAGGSAHERAKGAAAGAKRAPAKRTTSAKKAVAKSATASRAAGSAKTKAKAGSSRASKAPRARKATRA